MVKRVTVRTAWFFRILGHAFLRWLSASGKAANSRLLSEAVKASSIRLAKWARAAETKVNVADGFGRAGLPLLRKRVLLTTRIQPAARKTRCGRQADRCTITG
jgi:hypothetical protein